MLGGRYKGGVTLGGPQKKGNQYSVALKASKNQVVKTPHGYGFVEAYEHFYHGYFEKGAFRKGVMI